MTAHESSNSVADAQLQSARQELTKLPVLGPIMWLYARDPNRKYTFAADLDWRLMPPLVLDQCKVYYKESLPWAYFSWAMVSPDVDARLRSNSPIIAPHEWRSGSIAWLIDAVMPFGADTALVQQVCNEFANGQTVSAWLPNPSGATALQQIKNE